MAGHLGVETQVASIQVKLYTPSHWHGINVQEYSLLPNITSFTIKLIFMVLLSGIV